MPEPQDNHGPTDSFSGIPQAFRTLAHAYPALIMPFPVNLVEVKPGSLNQERIRALAYVDMRAYQARLDEVVGSTGWAVEYHTLGDRAVICWLTILGSTREDVGCKVRRIPKMPTPGPQRLPRASSGPAPPLAWAATSIPSPACGWSMTHRRRPSKLQRKS